MQTSPNSLTFEYRTANEVITHPSEEMMSEITQILKKHNALNRFGLMHLSETHLPENLVMHESCNVKRRHLFSSPQLKGLHTNNNTVETQWRLDMPEMIKACVGECRAKPEGHGTRHEAVQK